MCKVMGREYEKKKRTMHGFHFFLCTKISLFSVTLLKYSYIGTNSMMSCSYLSMALALQRQRTPGIQLFGATITMPIGIPIAHAAVPGSEVCLFSQFQFCANAHLRYGTPRRWLPKQINPWCPYQRMRCHSWLLESGWPCLNCRSHLCSGSVDQSCLPVSEMK